MWSFECNHLINPCTIHTGSIIYVLDKNVHNTMSYFTGTDRSVPVTKMCQV
jgi:hypothetical protein